MPEPSGKNKIHWWDNLVIQYIQELCWLAVPGPDQLKQPQITTLQLADFNRNDAFFWADSVFVVSSYQAKTTGALRNPHTNPHPCGWLWAKDN